MALAGHRYAGEREDPQPHPLSRGDAAAICGHRGGHAKVCWHAAQEADATVLTTVDRETPIRVRVPKSYEPPLQWVTSISDTIVSSVPSAKQAPSGCSA